MALKMKSDLDVLIKNGFRAFLEQFHISFFLFDMSAIIHFALFSFVLCNGPQLTLNEYAGQD
jgi:hypothetical protein